MIKIIYKLVVLFALALLTLSCSDNPSLQRYFVDSETTKGISMLDLPTSLLAVKDELPAEAKEALKTVKKVNLLAFKLNKNNHDAYTDEKAKIKLILKNKNYKELMRLHDKGVRATVKFLGDDDAMDEVIVYASDKSKGFLLARLIGDDMKPENMINLLENFKKMDFDNEAFKSISEFLQ